MVQVIVGKWFLRRSRLFLRLLVTVRHRGRRATGPCAGRGRMGGSLFL